MERETERVETDHGTFRSFRDDLVTRQLRRFGAHQRNELAMLLGFVRPGDRVVDVGAHVGTFSVEARTMNATTTPHATWWALRRCRRFASFPLQSTRTRSPS